jgi:Acyl-CoA dehydrogenase, N-terminal domain.
MLEFTSEQKMLRETIAAFAEKEVAPLATTLTGTSGFRPRVSKGSRTWGSWESRFPRSMAEPERVIRRCAS